MKYIFLENENFIQYADFKNSVVYLLNKTKDNVEYPKELIINEISEDLTSTSAVKLPAMMSYANEHYLENYSRTAEDGEITFTEPFEYEVYTDNKDKYYIRACVCDESAIKNLDKSEVETEQSQAF